MQKNAIAAICHMANRKMKILLIMKLVIAMLTLFCVQATAKGFSQNKVTISANNIAIREIFKSIEKQTDYRFLYHENNHLNNVKVSIDVKNKDVPDLLEELLKHTGYGYRITAGKLILLSNSATAFDKITGIVKDSTGNVLPGVSVGIKGKNTGTTTDGNGIFSISANPEDFLVFSRVGMATLEVAVGNQKAFRITMYYEEAKSEEVVVVGYGTQRKESITGAIASVRGEDLTVAPSANVTNTLAGRLPGLISLQSSGQPGFDNASLNIRGFGQSLVIVDGVEAPFNTIDPSEIASVSILKDGAASIYGARAGNGVILVTTKRGSAGKPVITVGSSYTLQGITVMPRPANAGQQTELEREAYLQSGQAPANVPWTEEQVQEFYKGTNPQYPNTNWYNVLIRNWAPMWQHNISVRGGSDRVKYYGYLGYEDQETVWKNSGGDYKRYNLLSNVDAKISKNFSFNLDLASTVYNRKYPPRLASATATNTASWEDFWRTLPEYPAALPDPSKNSYANGGGTGGAQLTTNMDIAGYTQSVSQDLKGTAALKYESHKIEGLSAKLLFNYFQNYTTGKSFQKPYKYYTYDYKTGTYTQAGAFNSAANMAVTDNKTRQITGQLSVNYDHIFAGVHQLKVLALFEGVDYYSDYLSAARQNFITDAIDQLYAGSTVGMSNNGGASVMGRSSFVTRVNYAYKNKYLLESILRADASAKFPSEKRWGYFPGVSVGWMLSQEPFMKHIAVLDELKLRASYGSAGNDGVGNFQYLTGYQIATASVTQAGSYSFGNGGAPILVSKGLANPDLTWEKVKIYNAGIDFSLFKRKLYGTGDVFYRTRTGIPVTAITSLPETFGATLPPQNLNSLNDRGFEFQLGTSGKLGALQWDINGNISWSRSKWDHYEEPNYTDPDQKRLYQKSGRWTDDVYGYLSNGLFTSQDQINQLNFNQDNNLAKPNSSLRPGDIRYINTNGDSILNWKDQVLIGKGTTPHWMFGFNINLKYKDFDLSSLFQGAFGYYKDLDLSLGSVYTTSQYNERWTTTNNNPNALIPRLGGVGAGFSDYRYKKADYLRLKTFSIGYNLPERLSTRIGLSHARVYIAGMNILTFDRLKKYRLDPEAPSAMSGSFYYPQQKTISAGINVSL